MSKIIEISTTVGSGTTPLKSNKKFWDSRDIRWLKTEQLGEYKIYDTKDYISKTALEETNIKIFPKNTISVAMYGEGKTRGSVSILANEMTTNQACCNIVIDEKKADYRYVYYWLKNNYIQLRSLASGVRKNLNSDNIKNFEIDLKDRESQQKIGGTLSLLDEMIDNNNKINAEAENMLKTIYNYWFLQFDFPDKNGNPYKSSGGEMVWNDILKREIPENWDVIDMSQLLIKNTDTFDYNNSEKTIDLSVMPSNSMCLSELNKSTNFNTNLFKMKKGDILFGSIRPYLKKAGIAPCDGAVAGTVYSYSVLNEFDYNYALITMVSSNFFNYAIKNSKGTKMPVIGNEELMNYKIPYNKEIVEKFNNQIEIKELICNNIMQNQELKELRDFLLPLLMSGQVKL